MKYLKSLKNEKFDWLKTSICASILIAIRMYELDICVQMYLDTIMPHEKITYQFTF